MCFPEAQAARVPQPYTQGNASGLGHLFQQRTHALISKGNSCPRTNTVFGEYRDKMLFVHLNAALTD